MPWLLSVVRGCERRNGCSLSTIASVLLSDELSVGFLVKCDRLLLERCKVRHVIDTER